MLGCAWDQRALVMGQPKEVVRVGSAPFRASQPMEHLAPLVSFSNFTGSQPVSGLTLGPDGNFYGTTSLGTNGGLYRHGTVFRVTPSGIMTTLAWFAGTNSHAPSAGLVLGPDGSFYGTTFGGGAAYSESNYGYGTVFKVSTNGELTLLASLDAASANRLPN